MEWPQDGAKVGAFTCVLIFGFPATPGTKCSQNYQPYGKPALPDHLLDDGASYEYNRQQCE